MQYNVRKINEKLNIIKLARSYGLHLIKKSNSYVSKCCFHQEVRPSLYFKHTNNVNLYHCFGCGAAGSSISFIMNYEKISFIEAVKKAARMINYKDDADDLLVKLKDNSTEKFNIQDINIYNYLLSIQLRNLLKKFIGSDLYNSLKKYVDYQFKEIDNFFHQDNLNIEIVRNYYFDKKRTIEQIFHNGGKV